MHLKTFTADNMASALKLVEKALGKNAIIIGQQNLDGGKVEVTAAVDSEARTATAPSAQPQLQSADVQQLHDILTAHGVTSEIIGRIEKAAAGLADSGFSAADTLHMVLGKMLHWQPPVQALPAGVHVLVGPTGAGKTTSIARMAVALKKAGNSVGLISLDNTKLGGFEPLAILADVLGDQAQLVANEAEFAEAMQALGARDYIFIDTPGLSAYDATGIQALAKRLQALGVNNMHVHLTLPVTYHAEDLRLLPTAFHVLGPKQIIFTKLDETRRWGGLVNVAVQSGFGVCYASDSTNPARGVIELSAATLANRLQTPPTYPWEEK